MSVELIYEPKIYVVGRQDNICTEQTQLMEDLKTNWVSDAENTSEQLAELAGRLCYMSFDNPRPGGNAAYLEHILGVGHGSVLEHAVWNFVFTGISRSLTHELVRHRAGFSYSQLSQRYVDESDVAFVVPPELKDEVQAATSHLGHSWPNGWDLVEVKKDLVWHDHRTVSELAGSFWLETVLTARQHYTWLSNRLYNKMPADMPATERRKAARESARSVLPNATETKIFVTANARSLRHFIELRASRHADKEIRSLAIALLRVLRFEAPSIFGDYTIQKLPDGTYAADTPYRKV